MTVAPADRTPDVKNARRLVQAAGFIFYLLAVQALVTAGVGVHVFLSGGSAADLLLPATSVLLAVCYAVVGFSVRRYRLWARNFAFAFAVVSLFAFPVGTVLGLLVVVFIGGANRARLYPASPRGAARRAWPAAAAPAEPAPVLRFEPDLVTEPAG